MRHDIPARRHALVALALLGAATPAAAQRLEPGQRIRVIAPDLAFDGQVGTLRWIDRDSLVLETDLQRLALPPQQVSRVDRSRGRKGHALPGLVAGAVVGLGAGFLLFQPGSSQCTGSGDYEENCMLYRGGVMLGGAALGALVGALIRTERWETVPLDDVAR